VESSCEPLDSMKCGNLSNDFTSGGLSNSAQLRGVSRSASESSYRRLYALWFLSVSEETLDK
jgi:hypothetical protein